MKQLTVQQQQWLDQQVTAGAGPGSDLSFSTLVNSLFQLGGVVVSYTSNAVVDTADVVPHTLGRIPTGYIVIQRTKAGLTYNGGAAGAFLASATSITLKNNVISVGTVLIVF